MKEVHVWSMLAVLLAALGARWHAQHFLAIVALTAVGLLLVDTASPSPSANLPPSSRVSARVGETIPNFRNAASEASYPTSTCKRRHTSNPPCMLRRSKESRKRLEDSYKQDFFPRRE